MGQDVTPGVFSAFATGSGDAMSMNTAHEARPTFVGRLIVRPLSSESDGKAVEVALDGRDIAIGRSPACNVVLDNDQLVSRRHALMRFNGAQYTIVDLGSSNGTYVNEVEIRQAAPLNDGDLIAIGEHELLFFTQSADMTTALPPAKEPQAPPPTDTPPDTHANNGAQFETVIAHQTPTSAPAPTPPTPIAAPVTPPALTWTPAVPWTPPAPPAEVPAVPVQEPEAPHAPEPVVARQEPVATQAEPTQAEPVAPRMAAREPVDTMRIRPADGMGARAPMSDPLDPRQTATNLEAISVQLTQASSLLKRLDDEKSISEQRRARLAEVRDQLDAILADTHGSAPNASQAGTEAGRQRLVEIARQTARNPRHIDYMMQLAQHADEVADALQGGQPTNSGAGSATGAPQALIAQLESLRKRVSELL